MLLTNRLTQWGRKGKSATTTKSSCSVSDLKWQKSNKASSLVAPWEQIPSLSLVNSSWIYGPCYWRGWVQRDYSAQTLAESICIWTVKRSGYQSTNQNTQSEKILFQSDKYPHHTSANFILEDRSFLIKCSSTWELTGNIAAGISVPKYEPLIALAETLVKPS